MTEKCTLFIELYETDYMIYANDARTFKEKEHANIPEELPTKTDIRLGRKYTIHDNRIVEQSESEILESRDLKGL